MNSNTNIIKNFSTNKTKYKKETINLQYVESYIRNSRVLIDCLHNIPPKSEFYVERIVREVANKTNSSFIVSKISRTVADLNRQIDETNKCAIVEYKKEIEKILRFNNLIKENNQLKENFLHISIHGMKNRKNKDIEIGTRNGLLSKNEISKWFVKTISEQMSELKIVVDDEFKGNTVLEIHQFGDKNNGIKGFGNNYNVFQVELSFFTRNSCFDEIVKALCCVVEDFEKYF